jgi:muramidase (phage lysozyme)
MTNAPSGAGDGYYVYRPVLNLIGTSEGTDKGRGYNETLGYGAYTGGPVNLVGMTLDQIDKLQTKMLQHPKNKLRSSALGRYQIIRTTLRAIREQLGLTGNEMYDAEMQDRLGCYLLGQRGIDKWLAGRLSLDTLIRNLAQEWASIPKPDGKGHYADQRAGVSVSQVKAALAEVGRRHMQGQPKQTVEVPVEVEKPVVPEAVEKAVTKQTNGWGWSGLGLGGAGALITAIGGWPWQTIAIFAGIGAAGGIVALVVGPWIVRRVKAIRAEVTA